MTPTGTEERAEKNNKCGQKLTKKGTMGKEDLAKARIELQKITKAILKLKTETRYKILGS